MKRMLMMLLLCAFATLAGISQAMADNPGKSYICHYSEYLAIWEKISIANAAVPKHLANHDDALPGGVTSWSGTALGEDCNFLNGLASCGDCLTDHGGLGCENADCEALIGGIDPFCVNNAWDNICADEAIEFCLGVVCEGNGD